MGCINAKRSRSDDHDTSSDGLHSPIVSSSSKAKLTNGSQKRSGRKTANLPANGQVVRGDEARVENGVTNGLLPTCSGSGTTSTEESDSFGASTAQGQNGAFMRSLRNAGDCSRGSDTDGGKFMPTEQLHKNFQDRLYTTLNRNQQRLSESQSEFFKMLDDRINLGRDYDPQASIHKCVG